ncbi:MAG TPA: hypothetical protein VFY40_19010 [Blastocatellia bacterium]|nr:hypothetical protein [Blastocatellia bacterium]
MIDLIEQLRRDLAGKGIIISDRRWGQALGLLQAHALTEGRDVVTEDDLIFLKHVLWQSSEQQAEIGKALARIGNPLNSEAVDYEDQAASAHRECMDAQNAAQSEEQKMQAAIEANTKLKQVGVKLHPQLKVSFAGMIPCLGWELPPGARATTAPMRRSASVAASAVQPPKLCPTIPIRLGSILASDSHAVSFSR